MKRAQLTLAVALFAAAGLAQAQQVSNNEISYPAGVPTRAEVRAQLEQARAQGQLEPGFDYTGLVGPRAQVTKEDPAQAAAVRSDLKAQVAQARDRGELDAARSYGGLVGPQQYRDTTVTVAQASRTRAEVRADLAQAQSAGQLAPGSDLIGLVGPQRAPSVERISFHHYASAQR